MKLYFLIWLMAIVYSKPLISQSCFPFDTNYIEISANQCLEDPLANSFVMKPITLNIDSDYGKEILFLERLQNNDRKYNLVFMDYLNNNFSVINMVYPLDLISQNEIAYISDIQRLDFDGNGYDDVVLHKKNYLSNGLQLDSIIVLKNNMNLSLSKEFAIEVGVNNANNSLNIKSQDLNADGKEEFWFFYFDNSFSSLKIFLNTGNDFEVKTVESNILSNQKMDFFDVNQDGNLDIIGVSNSIEGIIVHFFENLNFDFVETHRDTLEFLTTNYFEKAEIKALDMDFDNKLDILYNDDYKFSVLKENGDYTFRQASSMGPIYSFADATYSIGNAKWDGFTDFCVIGRDCSGGACIKILVYYEAISDSTFCAPKNIKRNLPGLSFHYVTSCQLADFNGDGVDDMMIGGIYFAIKDSNTIVFNVYMNNSVAAGMDQKSEDSFIEIYPNPVNGFVNIKSTEFFEEISLLDIYGKKIRGITNVNKDQIHLNISGFPAGTYVIKSILKGDNKVHYNKIIKY